MSDLSGVPEQLRKIADVLENSLRNLSGGKVNLVDIDPRDAVIYDVNDKKYKVSVQIQDGYEKCGWFSSRDAAIDAYVMGQKFLNHYEMDPSKVKVYMPVPNIKTGYKYQEI